MHFPAFCKTNLYTCGFQTQRTVKIEMFHLLLLWKSGGSWFKAQDPCQVKWPHSSFGDMKWSLGFCGFVTCCKHLDDFELWDPVQFCFTYVSLLLIFCGPCLESVIIFTHLAYWPKKHVMTQLCLVTRATSSTVSFWELWSKKGVWKGYSGQPAYSKKLPLVPSLDGKCCFMHWRVQPQNLM